MKKLLTLIAVCTAIAGYSQKVTDSTFYGAIKAGMLKSDFEEHIGDVRIKIMEDEYHLVPTFHNNNAELIELDIESIAEPLENFSIIESKMLSLYEVVSEKHGRPNTLSLIKDPEYIPDGDLTTITYWKVGEKLISIGAKRQDGKYVAVCNIHLIGYDEKLHDRDRDLEQAKKAKVAERF